MPDNSPPPDLGSGLQAIGQALTASSTPPDVLVNALTSFSTILNACIGLAITIIVIAFFAYLVRWVVASDGSENQKIAARGAFRAFLALFLGINIWWIMRLLDAIFALSPVTEYALFLLFFVLLTCWSLFGITDSVIAFIGAATDWILDTIAGLVSREAEGAQPSFGKWSRAFWRVVILAVIFILSLILLTISP